MSEKSRVWIYQTPRQLTYSEATLVRTEMSKFISEWKAHGNELMAGFGLLKNQFLVIALDESFNQASGCSIDSSVRVLKKLSDTIGVDFLDRSFVAFQNEDDEVFTVPLNEIGTKVKDGVIAPDTLIFNNNVSTLKDLNESWLIPAKESWLKRYFK